MSSAIVGSNLCDLLGAFAQQRVLVLGDAILDGYLEGSTGRLCREAPVPVVSVEEEKVVPGGAANTAANVVSLRAKVDYLGVIGQDWEGSVLRRALRERGVGDDHLVSPRGRRTVAKYRVVADAQMLVRYDRGSTGPIDGATEREVLGRLEMLWSRADAVIVSDYGYGLLSPQVIHALGQLQQRSPRILAVDSRRQLSAFRSLHPTFVKPNYREVFDLLAKAGHQPLGGRVEAMTALAEPVLELTGAQFAAVTLDTEGALILERRAVPYRTYAEPRPQCRAAGAGDTFTAALTLALAGGGSPPAAAEIASAAAAIVVQQDGTTTCPLEDLREQVSGSGKVLDDLGRLDARVQFYRRHGSRIVFTNGCFDILHRGHITHLNQAKALGDVLLVGVNSDASVRRLKGGGRPVNPLEDRLQVLAALSCVDQVVPFDEDTCSRLIKAVRPDVYVKGGNYTRESLPEAPLVESLGGLVEILPYLGDRSTTRIIQRVREAVSPGVDR